MKSIDRPGNSNKKRTRNKQRRSKLRRNASRLSLTRPRPIAVVRVVIVDLIAPAAFPPKIQT